MASGVQMLSRFTVAVLIGAGSALSGCASNGGLSLQTGSVNTSSSPTVAKAKATPACVALMAKITELRREGTPDRVAKVAEGKSSTVVVKRSALAKITSLNNANIEYQKKCGSVPPTPITSTTTTLSKKPPVAQKKTSALTTSKPKTTKSPVTTTKSDKTTPTVKDKVKAAAKPPVATPTAETKAKTTATVTKPKAPSTAVTPSVLNAEAIAKTKARIEAAEAAAKSAESKKIAESAKATAAKKVEEMKKATTDTGASTTYPGLVVTTEGDQQAPGIAVIP